MLRTQHRIDAICDFTQNILAVRATITRELLQKRKQFIKRDIIPEIYLSSSKENWFSPQLLYDRLATPKEK